MADESGLLSKLRQLISIIVILLVFLSLNAFSVLYCVEHFLMGDLFNNLFAFIQVVVGVSEFGTYLSLIYRMDSVRQFFDRLQAIFNQCSYCIL